ncbi:SDR family NAD(P)-dependent oxidoreductase [Bradyrhizobium barranii]|uniref:SDR family NAD(P)-dependent oxidoreductase n=1 Tax=Bradyrhizobium barranii TaxID=2992140 RepID=UPI003BB92BF5
MNDRFRDKVVIVTGAGSGIGAAAARRFHAEGAIVVLNGRREVKLAEVAAELGTDRCMIRSADVSIAADVERLVADVVLQFGRIDILVNNAGTGALIDFLGSPVQLWRDLFAVNVDGVLYMTRAALPHLIESGGSIVNVSSLSGLGGDRGLSFYNATKGAVSNLTRSLALDFGPRGVRINAVCPSLTLTDLTTPIMEQYPELFAKLVERIPPGARSPVRGSRERHRISRKRRRQLREWGESAGRRRRRRIDRAGPLRVARLGLREHPCNSLRPGSAPQLPTRCSLSGTRERVR